MRLRFLSIITHIFDPQLGIVEAMGRTMTKILARSACIGHALPRVRVGNRFFCLLCLVKLKRYTDKQRRRSAGGSLDQDLRCAIRNCRFQEP